jgi:hypothetical protein
MSERKPKFVLIDHSILDVGGHYYEYAVHVLEAARRAGYEPVLVTNREFDPEGETVPWTVHRAYRHGFWVHQAPSRLSKILKRMTEEGQRRWIRQSTRLRYSRLRLYRLIRQQLGDYLRAQPAGSWLRPSSLFLIALAYAYGLGGAFKRFLARVIPFPEYLKGVLLRRSREMTRVCSREMVHLGQQAVARDPT